MKYFSDVPKHHFTIIEKTYNAGAKKGQSYTSVTLEIGPYRFKRRTVRGEWITFSCNGCQKLGWYERAKARLLENGEYELAHWPKSHPCS